MDEVEQDVTGFIPAYGFAQVISFILACSRSIFLIMTTDLFQISGFMAVVLMGIWTGHHMGGFAWQSNPKQEFNWHPLLMTLGMIYLYGNGN